MEKYITLLKMGLAAFGGTAAYWLGGLDQLLVTLIVLIIIDYLSGVLKAIHNRVLDSSVGFKGITKKVMTLLVVALAFVTENATGGALPLREITIVFFIANEGISILENAAQTGLPIPEKLRNVLIQLKGGKDDTKTDSSN